MQCHYEDCATFGQIVSVCNNGVFMQLSGPCVSASCEGTHGTSCPPGQICVERAAGARIRQCMPNTCGAGPITCDCLAVACPGSCRITGAPGAGTFALCNNCPSGTCP